MKIKLGYDNYEDAKNKLGQTFCLYKGKAFTVSGVYPVDGAKIEDPKFYVQGKHMRGRASLGGILLEDPDFNCSDYNIGYINQHGVAAWFYRVPMKQYKQGLRHDQVGIRCSNPGFHGIEFKHGPYLGQMLENDYPDFKKAAQLLLDGECALIAFNRNFAMSRDNIHKDFILEYKGGQIGFSPNLEDFKLMPEHEHLLEALKEATA